MLTPFLKPTNPIFTTSIQNFCQGDNKALGAIYSAWLPELYLVAFRYVQSEQEAEDVVADCFEKLFLMSITKRHQKFIKDEINLKALLLVMVKNRSLDVIKTKKNRNRIVDGLVKFFPKFGLNGSKQTTSNENFKSLLACLPDKEKKIVTLHLEGFSNKEIGIQLEISEKTVANLLCVARKKIKQLWEIFME